MRRARDQQSCVLYITEMVIQPLPHSNWSSGILFLFLMWLIDELSGSFSSWFKNFTVEEDLVPESSTKTQNLCLEDLCKWPSHYVQLKSQRYSLLKLLPSMWQDHWIHCPCTTPLWSRQADLGTMAQLPSWGNFLIQRTSGYCLRHYWERLPKWLGALLCSGMVHLVEL